MNRKEHGFTIVELMLAMALVTFIFLFTLTVLTQLLTTYNRGLALTQINQAIRQLDNDIGKGLRFSSPGAFNSKYYDGEGNTTTNLSDAVAGVFCTGTVAYIWNVGNSEVFTYEGTSNDAVRLVRVVGAAAEGVYCASDTKKVPKGDNEVVVGSAEIKSEDVTNLLGSQAMVLRAIVSNMGHSGIGRLVKVQLALSTAGEGFQAEIREEGTDDEYMTCENTAHAGQYCSFGEFNSVVYLRGK